MSDDDKTVTIYRLDPNGRVVAQENATPSASGKTWRSPRTWFGAPGGTSLHRRADGWTEDRAEVIRAGLAYWAREANSLRRQLENANGRAGNFRGELRKIEQGGGEE
jgi:hypothetical protein